MLTSWCVYPIAFTDIQDSTVFQYPHAGSTPGRFPIISGTYTGSPTSISAKVIRYTDDSLILDWTVINDSPTGGTFSDTLKNIPLGGPYRLCVKSSVAGDTVRGSTKWGIGEVIGVFGQSNSMPRNTGGLRTTVNGFAVKYVSNVPYQLNDYWTTTNTDTALTSFLPSCSNKILSDINNRFPIAFCGYSVGGTAMVTDVGSGNWNSRNAADPDDQATLYGRLLSRIINQKPNVIIMYQGESDVVETTAAYVAAAQNMFSGLVADLGYTPIICIVQIREDTDSTTSEVIYWNIQKAHRDLANDSTVLLAATTYDLPTYDGTHLNGQSQIKCGVRVGRTIARIFNDSIQHGYRFKIDSAAAIDRGVVRIYINRISGNFIINKPINRLNYRTALVYPTMPIVTVALPGDTAIDIRINDRVMTSSAYIEYDKYRSTTNPRDSVIYDSDSIPLEPER
jgi:hypothetical protein